MPRITADTVAEHVAQQEAAVLAAAMRLFAERGYAAVTLADIAAEVGLKRTSLYRYFPDKAHIVLRWLRRELPEQAERSRAVLAGDGPPIERLRAWALHQLDYARRPEHRILADVGAVATDLDDAARAELAASHRALLEPLDPVLREAGLLDDADRAAAGELLAGLVLVAAEREARGEADAALRARLLDTIVVLARPRTRPNAPARVPPSTP